MDKIILPIIIAFTAVFANIINDIHQLRGIVFISETQLSAAICIITAVIILIDYFLLRLFLNSAAGCAKRTLGFVYTPILLLMFYDKIYGRIHYLAREINDPLKEIKYLIGFIIILHIILKLFYFIFSVKSGLKNKNVNKSMTLTLFLFCVYIFLPLVCFKYHNGSIGDEKEYIINTYSLITEGSFNLFNAINFIPVLTGGSAMPPPLNFLNNDLKNMYSVHSNLLAVYILQIPLYIAFGRFGIIFLYCCAGAGAAALIYKLIEHTKSDMFKKILFWSFCPITPIFAIYSFQIYPELLAGATNLIFLYFLTAKPEIKINAIITSVLASLIFWFNTRYLFFSIAYIILFFYNFGFSNKKRIIVIIIPFILSLILFLTVNFIIYGSFSISANTMNQESRFFGAEIYKTLFGLLFDQHFGVLIYAPFIIYFIFELILSYREFKNIIILIICYALPLAFYTENWFGGYSPPFRLLIPIMPALFVAGYYAYFKLLNVLISKWIFYMMLFYGIIMSIILTAAPVLLYNDRFNGNNQALEKIYWYSGINLVNYFPRFIWRYGQINYLSYKLTAIYLIIIIILFFIYSFEVKKNADGIINCHSNI